MVAHGRLGQAERCGKVAHARLGRGGDHRQQPQAYRITDRLEDRGQFNGLRLGQRPSRQRRVSWRGLLAFTAGAAAGVAALFIESRTEAPQEEMVEVGELQMEAAA